MPTRRIDLTKRLDRFIEQQVAAGHYENVTEVVCAGLKLLEQQTQEDQQKHKLLKSLAREATDQLDQGRGIPIGDERQLKRYIAGIGRRVAMNPQSPCNG